MTSINFMSTLQNTFHPLSLVPISIILFWYGSLVFHFRNLVLFWIPYLTPHTKTTIGIGG